MNAHQVALVCQAVVVASALFPYVGWAGNTVTSSVRAAAGVARVASLASSACIAMKQAIDLHQRRRWLRRMQANT
jgi:hypothetical protein